MLEHSGDSLSAQQFKRFFKEGDVVSLYGIKTPKLREIANDLFKKSRDNGGMRKLSFLPRSSLEICNRKIPSGKTGSHLD